MVLCSAVQAADYEAGKQAYLSRQYVAALRQWRPLAEHGLAAAQVGIGSLYANGEGVSRDDAEAIRWFRRAARQGDARGQFNLGLMLVCRSGETNESYWAGAVPPELDGAGFLLNGGACPQQDAKEAAGWFRAAAASGLPQAQYFLGLMYTKRQGVPQDNIEARKWLRMAAARGFAPARKQLAKLEASMKPEQLERARKAQNP